MQIVNGGNTTGRVGVVKSLSVSPGDQISISAYARYLSPSGTANPNAFITALASAFGVSSSSPGEALKIYNGLNSWAALVPNGSHTGDNGSYPKAFVTILLFDKNYVLQDAAWDQVNNDGTTHDLLSKSYTVKQPGYAYVFVSNEHPTLADIYFDDVTVSHTQSPIVAGSDYYPYGLVMDGTDITDEKYRYGYQGQYSEKDATTGWNEFELRMYDARFGRWLSVDPYGQYASGFVGMGNNPVMGVDPDGGWSIITAGIGAAAGFGIGALASVFTKEEGDWWKLGLAGAAVGGVLGGASFDQGPKMASAYGYKFYTSGTWIAPSKFGYGLGSAITQNYWYIMDNATIEIMKGWKLKGYLDYDYELDARSYRANASISVSAESPA